MFERFTESARKVVVLALEEAVARGDTEVRAEYLLVGLAREDQSGAAGILASVGVDAANLRAALGPAAGADEDSGGRQVPFTAEAKAVLERAARNGSRAGPGSIDTEGLLLGLLDAAPERAIGVLRGLDVDVEALVRELRTRIAARDAEPPSPPPVAPEAPVTLALTPRVEAIWQQAAARATGEGRDRVYPGDLLVAMVADEHMGWLLGQMDVDVARLRERIDASGWTEPEE